MILAGVILIWWFFARKSATEEVAFTWPFRELGEECFPYEVKKRLSKTFHGNGAAYVIVLSIGFSFLIAAQLYFRDFLMWKCATVFVLSLAATLFTYWGAFDPTYAKGIGKDWWFLGDTSDADNWLRRFGANAGKKKAYFCLSVTALCLAGYFLITKSIV